MNDQISPPRLSPRQRQILKLLQEGKVNKEVADELDIGLGTVKQHIVALFKKLKVSNRAMAVSRGLALARQQSGAGRALMIDGLLERRPCVVLGLSLAEEAAPVAARMLRGGLVEIASEQDAIFVARKGNAAELIFGIQQTTEYDMACAVKAVETIHANLLGVDPAAAAGLKGAVAAGFAVASMKRFGGWTGEAIASSAISQARELLAQTPAGQVAFAASAMELLTVFGFGGRQPVLPRMSLQELQHVQWAGSRPPYPLVGRETELKIFSRALAKARQGKGGVILLRGEMGMGKSRLCEEFAERCLEEGGQVEFFRCLPPLLGRKFYDLRRLEYVSAEEIGNRLAGGSLSRPALAIIDDFHLLEAGRENILATIKDATAQGNLVVLAGRKKIPINGLPVKELCLRRLSNRATDLLVRRALGEDGGLKGARKLATEIAGAALGVPLFAVVLAAKGTPRQNLPLPLQVVINARLHSLRLDRLLLQAVAQGECAPLLHDLASSLDEDGEQLKQRLKSMVELGILTGDGEEQGFTFAHPLLRRAIMGSMVERYGH